jgi:hypothetical protein
MHAAEIDADAIERALRDQLRSPAAGQPDGGG